MTAPVSPSRPVAERVGEHSPLPWSIHDAYEDTILDDAGVEVACCEGQCPATRVSALTDYANAELIVTAVNNYERLKNKVAVLEMVIAEELYPSDCNDAANAMIVEEILERSRA